MSQYSSINYKKIIQQQQEQLAAIQVQIQALLAGVEEGDGIQRANTEVSRLQIFNRSSGKYQAL